MRIQTKVFLGVGSVFAAAPWIMLVLLCGWPIPVYQLRSPLPYLLTAFGVLAALWWTLRWYGNN